MKRPLLIGVIAVVVASQGIAGCAVARSDGVFFADGWDGRQPGCSESGLLGRRVWTDMGPPTASTCRSGAPIAEVVTDERVDGNASARVTFRPDGSLNGPDWRIEKSFPARSDVYVRFYQKWSSNWVFADGDHKLAILGDAAHIGQNIYVNAKGNPDRSGRLCLASIPVGDSKYCAMARSARLLPDRWYRIEVHIVAGIHGKLEARLDGEPLTFSYDAGPTSNFDDINTGPDVGYLKLDTTYNLYSLPSGLNLTMHTWYDAVALGTGGWIGQ